MNLVSPGRIFSRVSICTAYNRNTCKNWTTSIPFLASVVPFASSEAGWNPVDIHQIECSNIHQQLLASLSSQFDSTRRNETCRLAMYWRTLLVSHSPITVFWAVNARNTVVNKCNYCSTGFRELESWCTKDWSQWSSLVCPNDLVEKGRTSTASVSSCFRCGIKRLATRCFMIQYNLDRSVRLLHERVHVSFWKRPPVIWGSSSTAIGRDIAEHLSFLWYDTN